jgi:regulator of protease activity HflC (stomatin/prohibitin superfamily)
MGYVWIIVLVAAIAALLYARGTFTRVTIFEFERGLRYDKGKFAGVLEPGRYWISRFSTSIRRVDIRPKVISIPGQEIITVDGVSLKASLAVTYEIADPEVAVNSVESFELALYSTLQVSLRKIIGEAKIDDVLERRDQVSDRLMELSALPVEAFGLKLIACNVRDIMFPGQLKKMFAQVVQAQKEGLAALERARGETAALRSLANAARMIEDKPALMQLRLLQEVGSQGGNTIVLGFPQSSEPLPLRDDSPTAPREIERPTETTWEEPD